MWSLVVGVALTLLFGWGLGWALALAVIGCGAMLTAVFWIGRSSVQQGAAPVAARDDIDNRRQ